MIGRLAGIARHGRPRGEIETLDRVSVSREAGVAGDFRGAVRPGRVPRRQISLIEAESWASALEDLGAGDVEWWKRRANLLLEGIRLPREAGCRLRIGNQLLIEITQECDPCSRMEEVRPGLKGVLLPDWRGGFLGFVVDAGEIALGDEVRIEE